jgi:hypothetical protein
MVGVEDSLGFREHVYAWLLRRDAVRAKPRRSVHRTLKLDARPRPLAVQLSGDSDSWRIVGIIFSYREN